MTKTSLTFISQIPFCWFKSLLNNHFSEVTTQVENIHRIDWSYQSLKKRKFLTIYLNNFYTQLEMQEQKLGVNYFQAMSCIQQSVRGYQHRFGLGINGLM